MIPRKSTSTSPERRRTGSLGKRNTSPSLLLGKSSEILVAGEDDDLMKIRELNEDAYSNLVLSIDTTTSAGKVAFSYVCGTKSADYEDDNAAAGFSRLTNKYAPKTAPSLAKTNRLFY
jgi:hypothetical protein